MKREETALTRAMDARLGALAADPVRRANIRQAVAQEKQACRPKRRAARFVFVLAALLTLTGTALSVGFNLFEYFGQEDQRLAKLAPDAVLEDIPASAVVESEPLGQTTAVINSAYYDGQSLLVGYAIQNSTRCEVFTPTAEQLAQMEPQTMLMMPVSTAANAEIQAQYRRAVEDGTPFGMVTYSVYPSDHTEINDDIDLSYTNQSEAIKEDGAFYALREYDTPLPQELYQRDKLAVRILLWQDAQYIYYDGSQCYFMTDRQPAGGMEAVIPRTAELPASSQSGK